MVIVRFVVVLLILVIVIIIVGISRWQHVAHEDQQVALSGAMSGAPTSHLGSSFAAL